MAEEWIMEWEFCMKGCFRYEFTMSLYYKRIRKKMWSDQEVQLDDQHSQNIKASWLRENIEVLIWGLLYLKFWQLGLGCIFEDR